MRYKPGIAATIIVMGIGGFIWEKFFASPGGKVPDSLYDFTLTSLGGEPVKFSQYRGKDLLIVNTASNCGYTPQYAELQKLHEEHGDKVTILGFPANNFLWQEPGTNDDIAAFCKKNYGVTFQMFQKISVRGSDAHPLYQWLAIRSGHKPQWNFCKYLINRKGEIAGYYGPKVSPLDSAILNHIDQ